MAFCIHLTMQYVSWRRRTELGRQYASMVLSVLVEVVSRTNPGHCTLQIFCLTTSVHLPIGGGKLFCELYLV